MTSLTLNPIDLVKIEEPRIALDHTRKYVITEGPREVTTLAKTANGNPSISQITFSTPPPNPKIAVDRKVYMNVTFRITYFTNSTTATAPAMATQYGQTIAPRDFPLSRSIRTLTVKLNNSSISIPLNQAFNCLRWYNFEKNNYPLSCTPNYPDQCQEYAELANTIRNPLGSYGQGVQGEYELRGAYNQIRITASTYNSITFELTVTEPLFISPLAWNAGSQSALYHLQTFDLIATLDTNLTATLFSINTSGLFAVCGGTTINTSSISIIGTPQLLFTYLTPPDLMRIPKSIPYPYYDVLVFPQDTGVALSPGGIRSQPINSIQIQTIPRRMYVFAKVNENAYTVDDTDSFARINKISVTLGNQQNLLSAATPQQLYQISRKNGCDMSFAQWYGYYKQAGDVVPGGATTMVSGVGSIFCAEFGSDIGLSNELDTPGVLKNDLLQITVDFQNISPSKVINFTVYVVLINEGVFTLESDLRAIQQIGVVTQQDVLSAKDAPYINYHDQVNIEGNGDFFGSLKNIVRKAIPYVEKAIKFAPKMIPYVSQGVEIAKALTGGCGECEPCMIGRVCPYSGHGDGIVGGEGGEGGKLMSRKSLRHRRIKY